jgi:EAL domain-containing protein (putative c-di-GMP-specific phosphodiesterase class I)
MDSTEQTLAELKAMNIGLKLDDFGTGYSSLSYLRDIHFDSLKIDQSFVKQLATNPESAAIVETIVRLAHALNMNVVAEGIEDEHQLKELIGLGCETGQGFYFAAPLEAGAAEKLLEAQLTRS